MPFVNPLWVLRTGRLELRPVHGADLPDLRRLKTDPRVFAIMAGGIRSPAQTAEELARDVMAWGEHGFGIWSVREIATNAFAGITGLQHRRDGRGIALRFALWPEAQGRGFAREAAFAALCYGHERARLGRIIAVARASNYPSRMVLSGIGMRETGGFEQDGWPMVLYESLRA